MAVALSNLSTTWATSAGSVNTAIRMNATDTLSAANSKLLELEVNGVDKFVVYKDGTISLGTGTPTSGRSLTLNNTSNYYGIDFQVAGNTVGKIIQEATGNMYYDANAAIILRTGPSTERARINTAGVFVTGNLSTTDTLWSGGNIYLPCANTERDIIWQFTGRSVYFYGQDATDIVGLYDTGGFNRWYTDTSANFTAGGSITATSNLYGDGVYLNGDANNKFEQGKIVLRNGSPTIYFRDTDANSAMIHNNSNLLYILRGGNDTESWSQINGQWPVVINLTNNDMVVGGGMYAVGDVAAYYSDPRLKKNVETITDALTKVNLIRGVTYHNNELAGTFGFDTEEQQVGVLSNEIESVLPEVVTLAPFDRDIKTGESKSGENYKTVKYERIVPLLIEAIKELSRKVDDLQDEIWDLKNK